MTHHGMSEGERAPYVIEPDGLLFIPLADSRRVRAAWRAEHDQHSALGFNHFGCPICFDDKRDGTGIFTDDREVRDNGFIFYDRAILPVGVEIYPGFWFVDDVFAHLEAP